VDFLSAQSFLFSSTLASLSILILAVLIRPGLPGDRASFAWWVSGDLVKIISQVLPLLQFAALWHPGTATGGRYHLPIFIPTCFSLILGLALQTKALARLCHVRIRFGRTVALVVVCPVVATAVVAMLPRLRPPLIAFAADVLILVQVLLIRRALSNSRALTIMAAADIIVVLLGIIFIATTAGGSTVPELPPLQALVPDFIESTTATFTMLMALQEREHAYVRSMSTTDQLTGTLNRLGFIPLLEGAWRSTDRARGPMSLAILDLDHFKCVNDTFGHEAGDAVLAAFAAALKALCRENDIVARWGGEEFLLLMPETRAHDAVAALKRIQAALPAQLEGRVPCPVTFSAGVYECGDYNGSASIDALIARADICLYQAKVKRDCIVSEPPETEPYAARPRLADLALRA
jgi:diguanylate cyclase (GGDEF)-like protein